MIGADAFGREVQRRRIGGGGGPIAKQPAVFDAVGWLNGPDGQPETPDDIRVGAMPADWRTEDFDDAARQMARPNGGYAPGGDWRDDGVAWTPETAVLAGAWATSPTTRERAVETLRWLAEHRTSAGSLPEKVLDDGSPAGPSPLAWTAAVTLTAAADVAG